MKNRKIVHTKPYLPRGYGKPRKRRKKRDYGAIGEALFIAFLIFFLLWAIFGIPGNAAEESPFTLQAASGGRKPEATESYFDDDTQAAAIFFRINEIRAQNGLATLEFDYTLADFAKVRARECAESWTHTRPDGSYTHNENLAKYFARYHTEPGRAVVDAWYNHTGHRETVLNPAYSKVGIASYVDAAGNDYYAAEFR